MREVIAAASAGQSWRVAATLLHRHGKFSYAALAFHAIAAVLAATTPYFIGQLVLRASQASPMSVLLPLALQATAFGVAAAVCAFFAGLFTVQAAERAATDLRDDVVRRVATLPIGVVESMGTGALVSRTTRDVATVAQFTSGDLPFLITISTTLAASVVGLIVVGGWACLSTLIVMPWLYVVFRNHFRRSRPAFVRSAQADARVDGILNETVEASSAIDALGVGQMRQRRYLDSLRRKFIVVRYLRRLRWIFFPAPTAAVFAASGLTVAWGAFLYERGWTHIDQVTAVALYTVAAGPLLTMMGFILDFAQRAETSLARLVGVVQADLEESLVPQYPQGSDLVADAVTFEYRPGVPVLHDVSVRIPSGQRVVMVGPSGSGKSSLARLFAGVGRPSVGSVQLGGADVAAIPLEELPSQVMLLTQEYHVFNGSLRDQLVLARESATDAELMAALCTVGADRWVTALPEGLDTVVSTGVHRLSPGHAQEVALARVLLADPAVVILDEATSLLEGESASAVEQAVDRALAGRTVIAIAHRLSAAEYSDRVIVVEGGRIVQDGSHDELRTQPGKYAELWRHWSHGRDLIHP